MIAPMVDKHYGLFPSIASAENPIDCCDCCLHRPITIVRLYANKSLSCLIINDRWFAINIASINGDEFKNGFGVNSKL